MGLFTDVIQKNDIKVEASPVVIKVIKNGAIIVCPLCSGEGVSDYYDYGTQSTCARCSGGGAITVKVKK